MSHKPGKNLTEVLDQYCSIDLSEIRNASLLNRIDSKYWFPIRELPEILEEVSSSYDLLKVNGQTIQLYGTHYYDTPSDSFYLDHHNGRANRIKVRKRDYVSSRLSFLEVKHKTPKGRTLKRRLRVNTVSPHFNQDEIGFLNQQMQEIPTILGETIRNQFNRITLVNHNLRERCTVDFDIQFSHGERYKSLNNIAIVELKQSGRTATSPLQSVLHRRHIHASSFSKYCIGRAILQPHLKQNRLKPTLLKIKKNEIK